MSKSAFKIIAVDGGAASGKSSTSKRVAEELNYAHVDTGAHFRTVTLLAQQQDFSPLNPQDVVAFLQKQPSSTRVHDRELEWGVGDTDYNWQDLRSEAVTNEVSAYSAIPELRQILKAYQRSLPQFAQDQGFAGIIIEGRDIGSVVFPDADVCLFFEADEQTRAKRRQAQGQADSIAARDAKDSSRKVAPLKCPEHAVRIDTSHLGIDEVVRSVIDIIHNS